MLIDVVEDFPRLVSAAPRRDLWTDLASICGRLASVLHEAPSAEPRFAPAACSMVIPGRTSTRFYGGPIQDSTLGLFPKLPKSPDAGGLRGA